MTFEIATKPGLICLERERIKRVGCRHLHVIVNEERANCRCKDCGEILSPMAVLCRFAKEESRYVYEGVALYNKRKKLTEKSRTKCQHCGRMTHVNITMSEMEWKGFQTIK